MPGRLKVFTRIKQKEREPVDSVLSLDYDTWAHGCDITSHGHNIDAQQWNLYTSYQGQNLLLFAIYYAWFEASFPLARSFS